jgi:Gpi18-like mannosyltransferase
MDNSINNRSKNTLYYTIGAIILIAAVIIRIRLFPIQTADYTDSLVPWLKNLHDNPGLTAFKFPFSDYPPLYLYLLKIISTLPFNTLYGIKTISVAFDFLIAYIGYKIVVLENKNRFSSGQLFCIFSFFLIIPTVVANSSLWAQCDALYSACVLVSFYSLLKNRPGTAAVIFGIAISLKLQSIFLLPVLAGYWLSRHRGWEYFFVPPIVYMIIMVPAWFSGGSLWDLLFKYAHQSKEYQALTLSAPTVYSFFNESQLGSGADRALSNLGIFVAALVAIGLIVLVRKLIINNQLTTRRAVFLALISVLYIPFLLPHMHERYFYLADIISVIYAIYRPRYWYVPVFVIMASSFSYVPFLSASIPVLSGYKVPIYILGGILLAVNLTLIPQLIRLSGRARRV